MTALRPCPFCGSPGCATLPASKTWVAGCSDNSCSVWPYAEGDTREEAVMAWNTRVAAEGPAANAEVKPVLVRVMDPEEERSRHAAVRKELAEAEAWIRRLRQLILADTGNGRAL